MQIFQINQALIKRSTAMFAISTCKSSKSIRLWLKEAQLCLRFNVQIFRIN